MNIIEKIVEKIRNIPLGILLIMPSLILIIVTLIGPFFYSLYISFYNWNITRPDLGQIFVGFGNYKELVFSRDFWRVLSITSYFVAVSVGLEILLGLGIALLLNKKFFGRSQIRSILIVPWAIPYVAAGVIWLWMFNANYGVINGLLTEIGVLNNYVSWLGTPFRALNVVIIPEIWKNTPFVIILFLATLQSIPNTYYEAAKVDGANVWNQFKNVTLPLLKPTLLTVLVLRTMWAFKIYDLIYVLTKGGPAGGTEVISYRIYRMAFGYLNFGGGAALSFILTLIILAISFIYTKLLYTEVEY